MAGFDRSVISALGAYGRNATRADWDAGKDFKIASGPYFSIRDIPAMKEQGIEVILFVDSKTGYNAFIVEL